MSGNLSRYATRVSVFLIIAALIAGMVGCGPGGDNPPPSQNLEIRTWYDLNATRNNLAGNHTLMNDLDSTTAGYVELASPTANEGKGWTQIGSFYGAPFTGSFDGQGYEIRDLFINRPHEGNPVGLFSFVGEAGAIRNVSVVNASVISASYVGGLVGQNDGTVSNSYSTGNVTANMQVGGLVGVNYGIVSDSYSSTNVIGDGPYVGGLVGQNDGTVSNSYSIGSVTGNSSVGGLVGGNGGTVSNSFWDIETSGQTTSGGGTGRNTTEMQDIDTFSGAGWNITAVALNQTDPAYIWNIINGVTYPFLSWQS